MNHAIVIGLGLILAGCDAGKSNSSSTVDTSNPADDEEPSVDDTSNAPDTADDPTDSGSSSNDTGGVTSPTGWRSALFPDDWTPGMAIDVSDGGPIAQLQDFSYAGYRAGEAPLPSVEALSESETISIIDHGADPTGLTDSTSAIQMAIDTVAADGGGVVFIPAGDYRVDGLLEIRQSGTVLLGESTESARLSFTRSEGMTDVNHLQFRGDRVAGESLMLSENVAIGETVLPVESLGDLTIGDSIGVGMVITPEWVNDHQMDGYWEFSRDSRRTIFQRTVVSIDTDPSRPTVTIDVPIRYPLLTRDSADIRRESGLMTECGIARLSLSSAVGWDDAWSNDRSHVLGFKNAQDCWASDLASWTGLAGDETHHLQSGGILVDDSRRITITSTTMEHAQNRGGGGNGYLFEIMQSDEILIHGSVGRAGRHNFIQNWDFGSTGNVFTTTVAESDSASSDLTVPRYKIRLMEPQ